MTRAKRSDVPRADMTPEARQRARRMDKHGRYMRANGKPINITPEELDEARALVVSYHEQGMSYVDMANQAGIARHVFGDLAGGRRTTLRRDTYDVIKAMTIRPAAGAAHVPPTGTMRRLQALRAIGFPTTFLAAKMGRLPENVRTLCCEGRDHVYASTEAQVKSLYEEFHLQRPEDYINETMVKRQLTIAAKHNFVPPHCWDDETIDDPNAFPEWTGECGTTYGRAIHDREGTPMCKPCKGARHAPARATRPYQFNVARFEALIARREISSADLAKGLGMEISTMSFWRNGLRRPRYEAIEKIADYFGVHVSELRIEEV